MTTDALRRLQALRGSTRTGSALAVLAHVQGDLRIVIEAVLELAGRDDEPVAEEPVTDEPAVGEQVTDRDGVVWQRCEDGWRWWVEERGWTITPVIWDYARANFGPFRATTGGDRRRVGLTDEPAIGEQVTDHGGVVWQRLEDGWYWWKEGAGRWSSYHRTWGDVQTEYSPLRATTDDDRRSVGLPVRDENTPPASQNAPQGARSADSGTGGPPEPENGAQGRIGWLRLEPGHGCRYLAREVAGGWTDTDDDTDDDLTWPTWPAEDWPDAEFTPIRTLADDEVAVKRADLRAAVKALYERERHWALGNRLVAALEECGHPNHGSHDHDCAPFRAALDGSAS